MLPTPEVVGDHIDRVYDPAEDSFLLLDAFEQLAPRLSRKTFSHSVPLVVELGTGTGIVSSFINRNVLPNAYYMATDINPFACETAVATNLKNASGTNFDVIRCDLDTALCNLQVDLLVFNPPYVPTETLPAIPSDDDDDDWVDLALDGGPQGMDVTNRVLDRLDETLAPNGEAYILFCARNDPQTVSQRFQKTHSNFQVSQVIFRKAGWEELSVYRFHKLN